ncbi:MAG: hypothetical protein GX442_23820 [Candidatus Riflebacteria bacterium]|nr:hypothetical protein [Candidatus Riflebacteria bacterium]
MKPPTTRTPLLLAALLLCLLCTTPAPAAGPEPAAPTAVAAASAPAPADAATDARRATLEKALAGMWLNGFDTAIRQTLEELAAGHDEVAARALFHLGCGALMERRRPDAAAALQRLEAMTDIAAASASATLFRRLITPAADGQDRLCLDVKDLPLPEIIRMVSRMAGRAVVVDEGVEARNLTLFLPEVRFEEVMKILANLGNLQMDQVGDILVVRNRQQAETREVDGTISLDFKDTDLRDVLRLIATKCGRNIAIHKSIRGKITIRLEKVTPEEAFRLVTRSCDLVLEKEGDAWLVLDAPSRRTALGGRVEKAMIPLQFLDGREALTLLNRERLSGCETTQDGRTLLFQGSPETLDKVRTFLQEQDKPRRQILIGARIWEFNATGTIDVKAFAAKPLAEKEQLARLIAAPRLITLSGRSARIEVGTKKDDQELRSGVELDLDPLILPDGLLQIQLKGMIRTETTSGNKPLESTRKIASTFVVKPGVPFTYEVQGGILPTVLEFTATVNE